MQRLLQDEAASAGAASHMTFHAQCSIHTGYRAIHPCVHSPVTYHRIKPNNTKHARLCLHNPWMCDLRMRTTCTTTCWPLPPTATYTSTYRTTFRCTHIKHMLRLKKLCAAAAGTSSLPGPGLLLCCCRAALGCCPRLYLVLFRNGIQPHTIGALSSSRSSHKDMMVSWMLPHLRRSLMPTQLNPRVARCVICCCHSNLNT
ncbi:hypothetical protein COO60DRAFT_1239958 [Scenedesmus sp. NREL 46B-D3]|nr:hypothetical protein COO60DRAFT_1239958 [Scenedesmus sp. NREL 46B-D3]